MRMWTGPGRPVAAVRKARRKRCGISLASVTVRESLAMLLKSADWSKPVSIFLGPVLRSMSVVITMSGTQDWNASTTPGTMCVAPTLGPSQTPTRPVAFA